MALTTRVWSAGKLLLLVAMLLLTYVVFAAASMRVAIRAREVIVPGLAGQSVNQATTALSEAGLTLKVEETRRPDPKVAAGLILTQEPPPGVRTRRQRSIKVWVSAGPRSSIVPAFVGETERTAQLTIQQNGLELAGVSEIRSDDYPTDVVVSQTPPPSAKGGRIALLVNRGERASTYVMPDLIGVNGDRAAEVMRTRGFRAAVVGDHPYPGVPAGVVLRQNPQAGFQIAPGEAISLEVSR
ncbi:MAG: PASTA domain-containing protein, partial [Vicinamibacterales bacterium]